MHIILIRLCQMQNNNEEGIAAAKYSMTTVALQSMLEMFSRKVQQQVKWTIFDKRNRSLRLPDYLVRV